MVKPVILMILDGWGHREEAEDNAIALANTPNWDRLWQQHAHTFISGSGHSVGLPAGQMGNSEVGHVNLGAGRVVYQDLTRVEQAIATEAFYHNEILCQAVDRATQADGAVHIMGLLSPGGVHSHEDQLQAAVKLAAKRGAKQVYVHAFLDGRDTAPKSAEASLLAMDALLHQLGVGRIASIVGRYYAMDRDNRWDRIEKAYDMLVHGKADHHFDMAKTALAAAYARGETDEFVQPSLITDEDGTAVSIKDTDSVIFMNFRADRARQLTHAFVDESFEHFQRGEKLALSSYTTLTEYQAGLPVDVAYPPESLKNVLGEVLADHGLQQLRIAETEKYAHVTFFFNGGVEQPFSGEERILVPSPKVATYDLQPEMNAAIVADKMIETIEAGTTDCIICNFANADMVGHTGKLEAAIKAIEALDACIGRVVSALQKAGGEALITADHGNAELMRNAETGQPHTAHTNLDVPLLYVGRPAKVKVNDGVLSDVAPTLLHLMGLAQPAEMTGRVIFEPKEA